jgi:hypothetical protein
VTSIKLENLRFGKKSLNNKSTPIKKYSLLETNHTLQLKNGKNQKEEKNLENLKQIQIRLAYNQSIRFPKSGNSDNEQQGMRQPVLGAELRKMVTK